MEVGTRSINNRKTGADTQARKTEKQFQHNITDANNVATKVAVGCELFGILQLNGFQNAYVTPQVPSLDLARQRASQ